MRGGYAGGGGDLNGLRRERCIERKIEHKSHEVERDGVRIRHRRFRRYGISTQKQANTNEGTNFEKIKKWGNAESSGDAPEVGHRQGRGCGGRRDFTRTNQLTRLSDSKIHHHAKAKRARPQR